MTADVGHADLDRPHSATAGRGFEQGGAGAADLAQAVVDACEQPSEFRQLYPDDAPIREKIETVAKRVYGARGVFLYPEAERSIDQFERDGLGHFPVSMAKTHLSLSADATLANAPHDFTVPVRNVRAYTGAGWCHYAATSSRCRASARRRGAVNVDIDAEGQTVGLF